MSNDNNKNLIAEKYAPGFHDNVKNIFQTRKGLGEDVIRQISAYKKEPAWMLAFRLAAYKQFLKIPNPTWGADLSFIDFNDFYYFVKAADAQTNWDDVPAKIKDTFNRLGILEAEQKFLAGVTTQYDSESVYHHAQQEIADQGVIFTDTDTALREHPELFKKYFGTVVPPNDNKYAALNSATWSGGSFIYVPPNTKVKKPLQSYFRINYRQAGQFERTLIIVDEGAELQYVEGCTAPIYSKSNLHAAIVEIIVHPRAKCTYTTIQNWSDNVLNLVTKRAIVQREAYMRWVDGNIGAQVNMKYPSCVLQDYGATGSTISIAVAKQNMLQDAGAKMIHLAPHTRSNIVSKTIAFDGGISNYRGLVKMTPQAHHSVSRVQCDTLLLDDRSKADTVPHEVIHNGTSNVDHEAAISKISQSQLFYLMSRGISEKDAEHLIVMGFLEPFAKQLPMEYAVELNRLVKHDMAGSIG